MPQNHKLKKQPKPAAANKHGKAQGITKKGRLQKPPKKSALKQSVEDSKAITKMVNSRNEASLAQMAKKGGRALQLVDAPPVALTKDQQQRKKAKNAQSSKAPQDAPKEHG